MRARIRCDAGAPPPNGGGVQPHAAAGAWSASCASSLSSPSSALAIWAGATVANASDDPALFEEQSYTVRPGDTLWRLAEDHYGDTGADPREIVWEIERRNGLDGAALTPGQAIVLPPASAF